MHSSMLPTSNCVRSEATQLNYTVLSQCLLNIKTIKYVAFKKPRKKIIKKTQEKETSKTTFLQMLQLLR
jgi:hypothetical protein